MKLSDLVDYVCTKTQLVEDDDKAACSLFLSKRYELIYNAYLWKDSLWGIDVNFDPANEDNAEGVLFVPEGIDRVVALRTKERSVRVRGLEDYYRVDYDRFCGSGPVVEFGILSPVWFVWRATGDLGGLSFNGPLDDFKIKVTYRDEQNRRMVVTGGGSQGQVVLSGKRIEVESVFKTAQPAGSDAMPVITMPGADNLSINGQFIYLNSDDTRSPAYQRLRLFSIPKVATVFSVLGKMKFVPLDFDTEEPLIRNLDNCLIAFATGDMLKRARQFGKAQAEYQEGALLLQELAKLEVMQAANNSRIVPDGGFGDPFFDPGHNGMWNSL